MRCFAVTIIMIFYLLNSPMSQYASQGCLSGFPTQFRLVLPETYVNAIDDHEDHQDSWAGPNTSKLLRWGSLIIEFGCRMDLAHHLGVYW